MIYQDMLRLDADVLLRETTEFTKQERWATARLLVRLAAVERRELYAPCGYPSMWEYCLGELGMSEDAASRRLWAARKCREFPALFDALVDGHITLTAVHLLATHLRPDNADELVAAAAGLTKAQILDWLACRFPRPAVPTVIQPVTPMATSSPDTPVEELTQSPPAECEEDLHALARVPVPSTAPDPAMSPGPLRERAHVDPLNADQIRVQFTMSRGVLARLRQAQDLLGHQVARDDLAALFEKLLDLALPALEKQKFAATDRPREPRETSSSNSGKPGKTPASAPRTIPARVKREVWKRDGGRCTFTSGTGRRCACTRGLEFDHVKPVALGGEGTVHNVRLLCWKHNQLEAERRLGAKFMRDKRAHATRQRMSAAGSRAEAASGPAASSSPSP